MSDSELTNSNTDAQRAKLAKLIAAKKGKGGASMLEAKEFTDAWIAYVKMVGVNDETVGMLYDGFQFAAGEPLYRYAVDMDSETVYVSFFTAKPTRINDQGIALKVAINLLALELPAPTSNDSVRMIAHAIPKMSQNKDGRPFGTLVRSIPKMLIRPLVKKEIDENAKIGSKDAAAVLAVLRNPVEAYAKNTKIKRAEFDAAVKFLAWLENQATSGGSGTTMTAPSVKPDVRDERSPSEPEVMDVEETAAKEARREARRALVERPVRVSRIKPVATSAWGSEKEPSASVAESDIRESPAQTVGSATDTDGAIDMRLVQAFLIAYKSEHDELMEANEKLRAKNRRLASALSQSESRVKEARREICSLNEKLSGLSEHYAALQSEAISIREANESLSSELSAAEEMLSVIDRRDAREADESSKRLASELKVEYRDYLDAADLPMDADLGENMREQLKNVFDILASNGINL